MIWFQLSALRDLTLLKSTSSEPYTLASGQNAWLSLKAPSAVAQSKLTALHSGKQPVSEAQLDGQ